MRGSCGHMRSLLAIRKQKSLTTVGKWVLGRKMPRNAFPLSRSHSYPLGSSFDWCLCEAVCGGGDVYRLLVAFDRAKEQYRAWLGLISGNDTALLGRLEFHPCHRGWHCHLKTGPVSKVVRGVVKEPKHKDRVHICNKQRAFSDSQLACIMRRSDRYGAQNVAFA